MAVEPQARYASPRELADEIEHWLADEPVAAYREPWLVRAGRWARRNKTLVTGTAALLLTAVVALSISTLLIGREQQKTEEQWLHAVREQEKAVAALRKEEQARKDRALAQVNALLEANPQAVPSIIAGLEPFREDVLPRLRELWARQELPTAQLRRVGLALLPVDAGPLGRLRDEMLRAEPREILLLRDALASHRADLTEGLCQKVDAPQTDSEGRFRALVALAAFDAGSRRWEQAGEQVADPLLSANPLHLGLWTDALRPVRGALLGPLARVFRDPERAEKRQVAATILGDYAADRPNVLTDLLLDADPRQYAVLLPKLQPHREKAIALLNSELAKTSKADSDALAKRQAQAAVALLQFAQGEAVWPLFQHRPDPSLRTYLIHRLSTLGAEPQVLCRRLELEPEVSARRALILCLGEFTEEKLPAGEREALSGKFLLEVGLKRKK